MTGLSHYILEALDVELLFGLVCLVLRKRGHVFFSLLFPLPDRKSVV